MKGKMILNIAMSIDGYIATETGGFDWIVGDGDSTLNTEKGFDFAAFLETVDSVVMGRHCYEQGFAADYTNKEVFVATSQSLENKDNIHFIKDDIVAQMIEQRNQGKSIYLFGGASVVDPFIKADCIDEYIVGIIPVVLGKGRRLFYDDNPMIRLHLKDYIIDHGITILHYAKHR